MTKRSVPTGGRIQALARLALLGLLLAPAGGCVVDGGGWDPGGYGNGWPDRRSERDAVEAYDVGYRRGERDYAERRRSDPGRWDDDFGRYSEEPFVRGYRDGYEGRDHRYADRRGRDRDDDRYAGDPPPGWLVGGFKGFSELYDFEVALSVDGHGRATVIAGRERHSGSYRDGRIVLRNGSYSVRRAKNGVRLVADGDPRNETYLRRIN